MLVATPYDATPNQRPRNITLQQLTGLMTFICEAFYGQAQSSVQHDRKVASWAS